MKLYVSKAKSIHKENEEKGIWNQKDHIKKPDGAAKKRGKEQNFKMFVMINGLIKVSVQNSVVYPRVGVLAWTWPCCIERTRHG